VELVVHQEFTSTIQCRYFALQNEKSHYTTTPKWTKTDRPSL